VADLVDFLIYPGNGAQPNPAVPPEGEKSSVSLLLSDSGLTSTIGRIAHLKAI
jgi:hypothetical protein